MRKRKEWEKEKKEEEDDAENIRGKEWDDREVNGNDHDNIAKDDGV